MKRIGLLFLLIASLSTTGMAATFMCRVQPGMDYSSILASLNASVIDSIPEAGLYYVSAPSIPKVPPPGVEYIETSIAVAVPKQTFAIVSKSTTSKTVLWYQQQPALNLIKLPDALKLKQGNGIVIADINSAVDYGHQSLIGHLTNGYDFVIDSKSPITTGQLDQSTTSFLDQSTTSFLDQSTAAFLDQSTTSFLDQSTAAFLDQSTAAFLDTTKPAHGHATIVAGILAAVAPQAQIMPLRTFNDKGQSDSADIVRAIKFAVKNGAHVINMSFGLSESSKAIGNAIDYARQKGVVVVASAGNNNWNIPQYPAVHAGVISVTATTLLDQKASFANYGSTITVSAPGNNIISAYPGGDFVVASGTSFAAPMMAGEAALRLSYKGSLGASVSTGVVNIDTLNPDYVGQLGYGRIDLLKALK